MEYSIQRTSSLVTLLFLFVLSSYGVAAESTPVLTIGQSGADLYSSQDEESSPIGKLKPGERVIPLAEAVGRQSWYMVKTEQGSVGWVRAANIVPSAQVKEAFKEQSFSDPSASTWSARTSHGRTFEGSWTVDRGSSAAPVSGTWTVRDPAGKIELRGTWSAEKFSTGWQGVWRALIDGRSGQYGGTWTADFSGARDTRLADLFEAAAKDTIRGVWSAGGESGSWTIRAAN